MARPHVEIEGLRDLQREVRRARDSELTKEMKKANKAAASIPKDRSTPPRRSGSLAASVKVVNSARYAAVRAGTPKRVPYAGVIHFGWPARNIAAQPWLDEAIHKNFRDIRETYEDALHEVARLLESKKR